MSNISNFFGHIKVVNKHRWLVFKYCSMCGFPIRGLLHDLSKYSYAELSESIKYFKGDKSPLANCKMINGHSYSWDHHKGRNKHHFEYYIDVDAYIKAPIIPFKYVVEMICDNISAGQTYKGYDWDASKQLYYLNMRRDTDYINPKIYRVLERTYIDIDKYGLKKVLNKKYLKKIYDEEVYGDFKYKCYLGGTIKSTWRKDFIKLLNPEFECFNPTSKEWNHTVELEHNRIKKDCEYIVYVIDKNTKGYLAICNAVNLCNKMPNRILTCFLTDGMSKEQINSLEEVEKIILNNRAFVFHSLEELAKFVNES